MAVIARQSGVSAPVIDLIDQMATGVAVLDDALRFVHANPAFVELTGAVRWRGCPLEVLGEVAGDVHALVARARATQAPAFARSLELAVHSTRTCLDMCVSECREGIVLELHAVPAHEFTQAPLQISHSLRGLAHEVKNPLAGLRGAAQLLHRRVADADQQRLAELIISEADRLGALTDRLLHPRGKPHLAMFNLHAIAERARSLVAMEAAPQIRIERDYDPSLPAARGDADRLLQMLLNLLRNALQADATQIRIRTRAEHAAVLEARSVRLALRLDVIDNGHGVPESVRQTLFAPLVSGRVEGTGMGLALAHEIMHEHGGTLEFHSRPGHTVFSARLPAESSHD